MCDRSSDHRWSTIAALGIVLIPSLALTGNCDEVSITARERWSNVFGGSDAKLHFDIAAKAPIEGTVRWSYSANRRTIANGESNANVARGKAANVEIPLRIPPVNDGVIFSTELSVSFTANGEEQPSAEWTRVIWVFPRDPFVARSEWLKGLQITLFDPEDDTAEVFSEAKIPFTRIRSAAALDDLDAALVVIGERISLARNRTLDKSLLDVAARGIPVLCLAPRDGQILVPGTNDDGPVPTSLSFRRGDVITEIDKRLDATGWLPDGEPVDARFGYRGVRSRVILEQTDVSRGWPWIETRFRDGGSLVVCGFGIIDHWDDSPTPRFLLARLFERLTNQPKINSSNESLRE